MASAKNNWTSVVLKPLSGIMDVRSDPPDIIPGGVRWRQNILTNSTGHSCLRDGFSKAFDQTPYSNWDHHHQGATRERITLGFESIDNSGVHRFFDGTQSRVSLLDSATGLWTDIVSGKGAAGSRFKAAELQDYILFTNNVDQVFAYTISSGAVIDPIPGLANAPWRDSSGVSQAGKALTAARVIIQYQGVIFLMNVFQDGVRQSSRITWCDLNDPLNWLLDPTTSIAGFQDLTYGDSILAAAVMNGVLYVYTVRGIWRIGVNSDTSSSASPFVFKQVYSEPENGARCIAFPNTLVSDGNGHWYMGRDAIYHFTPYLSAPERVDWVLRADGAIYTKLDTKINVIYCDAPIAWAVPNRTEVNFSWPSAGAVDNNNWTLHLNTEQKSADIEDAGYTAVRNFSPDPDTGEVCNTEQDTLGVSGLDWCWKDIGNGVYSREISAIGAALSDDLPLDNTANYSIVGYYRILRGPIPLGLVDREKIVRFIVLDSNDTQQDAPCIINMRIGNSWHLVDPNSTDESCAVMWRTLPPVELKCPDPATIAEMRAKNQRPDIDKRFTCFDQGVYLYYEMKISNADGTPAIGGASCLLSLTFDSMPLVKP